MSRTVLRLLSLAVPVLLASGASAQTPRFTAWNGPHVPIKAKPGDAVWCAVPFGSNWDTLALKQHKLVRIEGKEGVVESFGKEIFVPSALITQPRIDPRLQPGNPVLVYVRPFHARYARLVSKGPKYKVNYRFASKAELVDVAPTEVVAVDGRVGFGAPIGFKEGKDWKGGMLVFKGARDSWVIAFANKLVKVPTATIRAVKPKNYKAGDKVWARWVSSFRPATVVQVLEKGLAYKVQFEGSSKPDEVTYAEVTAPLE